MGSKVLLGNLLVIPIQDSLLYVEPLYIRAENGQLPELQRVIAAYSDRVVMGDTLDITMAALFINQPPPAPTIAKATTTQLNPQTAPAAVGQRADLHAASEHYNRALAALRTGDWTEFGNEMKKLGEQLSAPPDSTHQ
jgi:uncharacterized membrane protein (UPF0182 family)